MEITCDKSQSRHFDDKSLAKMHQQILEISHSLGRMDGSRQKHTKHLALAEADKPGKNAKTKSRPKPTSPASTSVRTARVQCQSNKIPPKVFWHFFPTLLGVFCPNFTCLLHVPIYARLQIFIQLSAILTKLRHIKRDHPVQIICLKCPPSAETHAGIFCHFS